jgi:HEAT repeat protein
MNEGAQGNLCEPGAIYTGMDQRRIGWIVGALAVLGLAAVQSGQMSRLEGELANLRAEVRGSQEVEAAAPETRETGPRQVIIDRGAGLQARLARLELVVENLTKATDVLVERGMVPPTEERLAALQQVFFDPMASEGDRLRSLRQLRRSNRQLSDEIVGHAMTMLQTSTNGNTRRQLLQNLDGVTNAAMKQPLMAMLATETTGNVREELVDVLSEFASDPAVEDRLWQLAMNDPDGRVKEEALDALTDRELSPQRVDQLRAKALSSDATLDERLMAMRALRESNTQAPEVITEMANLAQSSTDPVTRARLFQAFDGINDPNLMPTLVHGLQDPNPVVRENAADALGSFASDPRIQEWLNHVIQTDADPRVKREAMQALEQSQRRGGGRRGR